jgi:pimeloyl-ACP methyl ester carboxylesterase
MTAVARWDAPSCEREVTRLFVLAADLDRAYEQLSRTRTGLADWRGPAAERALPRLRLATLRVSRLAGLVRQAADAVRSGLQGVTEAAWRAAGTVQSPGEAAEVAALARAVDARMAAGLAAVAVPAAPPDLTPPAGATPAEVARWWTALPPDRRQAALRQRPAELGATAGLPADVRDAANRIELARRLARLRAERDQLTAAPPLIPLQLARLAVVRWMLAVAQGVERALAGHPRARLLTLDLSGSGRVAIGLGDVDRARHVAVVVPGMGTDAVHGVDVTVRRADQLRAEAERESVEPTAVVAWVGYASPGLREVPFPTRARAGGRLLATDLAALTAARTADGGRPAHVTVVGHSYGSTVAGAAARLRPRLADDLVLLGSPGVLADHAGDLGVGTSRVYVGEAPLDPVADLAVFGRDPGDRGFGATRMRADPGPGGSWPDRLSGGNHSHYFDPGSESLRNIARVVVGRGPDVTREDS